MKFRGSLLLICYLGFVSLGLPDPLIGVAWPSVRQTFGLEQSHISWIFFGGGCSYFLSSFFAGRLLKLLKVGALLAVSSGLVALSGFNFGFATVWPWFAAGAILHGLGSGAIDSGLNHYVATHFSARHMNWLHASYSSGAMLGPIIMTACIVRAGNWRYGYLVVASILATLAILFLTTRSAWTQSTTASPTDDAAAPKPSAWRVLRQGLVQLNIALFFLYTGLEVALGQWSFTVLVESRGVAPKTAGAWVTIYWAGILAGRVLFGFIVDRVSIDQLIRFSMITAASGTALFLWNPFPSAAALALGMCGVGLAIIFPCLMTRTPQRLGKDVAEHAIGFQVGAAMLGAAALPSLCGVLAQQGGLQLVAPTLLVSAFFLVILHEAMLLLSPCNVGRSRG